MNMRDKFVGTLFIARSALNRAIRRLDGMLLILRLTCLGSLCAGLAMLVICILQTGTFGINDERLSWAQIRAAGYYPFLVIVAVAMTIAGLGIWMRRGWSRWLVVLLYLIDSPIEIIYWRSHPHGNVVFPWGGCIGAVVWAAFFYWYLFYNQKKAFD
jgi:hypothetical protein